MDLQLHHHTAIVIGGAQGIGRAIVESFAAEGAHVIIGDLDESAQVVCDDLAARHDIRARFARLDATEYAAVRQLAKEAGEMEPRRLHLIYAAGTGSGKYGFPFWNLQPSDWPRVLDVNLIGAVNAAHAFAGPMTKMRQGTMLFIASVAGQIGSPTDPPYSAAKAGLINFAQCAARDLAAYQVRVNCVSPGMVKTELNQSVWQAWHDQQPEGEQQSYEQWTSEKIARVTPLGRWQQPMDIAAAAVFLASDLAQNITGQTLNVDGGHVMHS